MTYEQKYQRLDEILTRLDNSETPIDELAEDVKEGARLIKELDKKLKMVETEVVDAFKELDYTATIVKEESATYKCEEDGTVF